MTGATIRVVDPLTDTDSIRGIFAAEPAVALAYLFGSRASGRAGPMSDYDFGVLFEHGAESDVTQAALATALARAVGTDRVDLVVLNRAPVELAYAVIAQGVVIYQRDTATRVEYEAGVLSRYGDYLPVLRMQRGDILRGEDYAARVQRYREAFGRTRRALGQAEGSG